MLVQTAGRAIPTRVLIESLEVLPEVSADQEYAVEAGVISNLQCQVSDCAGIEKAPLQILAETQGLLARSENRVIANQLRIVPEQEVRKFWLGGFPKKHPPLVAA